MSKYSGIPAGATYIHYQPERIDYAISDAELNALCGNTNNWKDFCIACTSVGAPCMINAIVAAGRTTPFVVTLDFNLNLVVGIIGIALGLAFGIAWWQTHKSIASLVSAIKQKPKLRIG